MVQKYKGLLKQKKSTENLREIKSEMYIQWARSQLTTYDKCDMNYFIKRTFDQMFTIFV